MSSAARNNVSGIRRVFFDCTATHKYDANTGVQRVVRNIISHSGRLGPELGLECQAAEFRMTTGFATVERLPSPSRAVQSPIAAPTARRLRRLKDSLRSWLTAANLIEPVRQVRRLLQRATCLALFPARRLLKRGIDFQPGDVLLLIDDSCHSFPWEEVRAAQSRGAVVGLLLYDLIPVQVPESVGPREHVLYCRWWNTARQVADFVVGISNSVLDDADAVDRSPVLPPTGRTTARRGIFRLGADLDGRRTGGSVRETIRMAFAAGASSSTYLMVGMMSPRKNYALALAAFEQTWASGLEVRLVIAGKYGWDCEELRDRIRRHPQLEKQLYWFEDACDGELEFCYRHAAGLITTSSAEGFNLPIVEALRAGCPVLASDLPVHREVGGTCTAYFPPRDAAALATLLQRHQREGKLDGVKPTGEFQWPDWAESCRDLLECVLELAPAASRENPALRPAA